MSKKERYKRDLIDSLLEFLETGDTVRITEYLVSNSNLPGPRANLELAGAFSEAIGNCTEKAHGQLWELCTALSGTSEDSAPTNTPQEFIPFCGVIGIGAIGSASQLRYDKALAVLKTSSNDRRWRMREAVRIGLQSLMETRRRDTLKELEEWITGGDLLEMRAAAATVAEPSILKDSETAVLALQMHHRIIERVLKTGQRKSEGFLILRKALGYTLSVVVSALPREGFEYLAQLSDSKDPDVMWILSENLKKNRLRKDFPEEVEAIRVSGCSGLS